MRRLLEITLFFGLSWTAFGQTIEIAYDRHANFSEARTYSWFGRKNPEISAPDHSHILQAIGQALTDGGMVNVDLNPDVWVSYFAQEEGQVVIRNRPHGFGVGPGWSRTRNEALLGSSPESSVYRRGTIVVDIYHRESNAVIWRGTVSANLGSKPEKNRKAVGKALSKLLGHYPPE